MSNVWFVSGDEDRLLFKTKEDSERYARMLYPNEDPDTRYARIYCRTVYTWVIDEATRPKDAPFVFTSPLLKMVEA